MSKSKLLIFCSILILIVSLVYTITKLRIGKVPEIPDDKLLYFEDKEMGVSFMYPDHFKVNAFWNSEGGETKSEPWRTIDLTYNSEKENDKSGWFFIEEYNNLPRFTDTEWEEKFKNQLSSAASKIGSVNIDGRPALIFGIPNSCKSAPGFAVIINNNGKYVHLFQSSNSESQEYIRDVETVLRTLIFLADNTIKENNVPNLYYPDVPDDLICE